MFSDLTVGPSFKVKRWFTYQGIIIIILGSYIASFFQSALHSITPARIANLGNLTYCCHARRRNRNLLMYPGLTLGPAFKVKQGYPNLEVVITCLLLVLEVCSVKPTYRKSWAGNLSMWSDLTLDTAFKVK